MNANYNRINNLNNLSMKSGKTMVKQSSEKPDFLKISDSLYSSPKKRIKRKSTDAKERPGMVWHNRTKFNRNTSHVNTNQTEG